MVLLKVMLSKQVLPKPVLPHVEKLNSTNESETLQGKGWSRAKISGPNGPEIFGLGSGLGPALGSGLGARLGSAPRLTLLPWLQFFLPTPPFALQCIPH